MTSLLRTPIRLVAVIGLTALFAVPFAPAVAGDKGSGKGNSNDKQTICHRTNSNTNPYVVHTPNKNGDVSGHADHKGPIWNPGLKAQRVKWGDIIPPFDYNNHGVTARFPGLNWDANGQAWFANDCRVPIRATVVKTNDANGDGTFGDDETAAAVGASVPFKVVITNTSVVPALIASLSDAIGSTPLAFTCSSPVVGATLAAGASATCEFTLAGYSPAHEASVVNTVTARLNQVGHVRNGVTVSDTSTVRTFVPNPDVSIVKTGPASASPGDTLTWTLSVHNDGNVALTGVTVTDSLPAGTTLVSASGTGWSCSGTTDISCALGGSLAVDASASMTLIAALAADYTASSVSNTGVVTPTDATPLDNTSTVTTVVTPLPPDVSIVKTGTATAAPGDDLTWTLTANNDGAVPASAVTITDSLPSDTTLVSVSGTGWTCSGTTDLSCVLDADLGVGASSAVTVVATLSAAFTGTSVSNTAVITPTDATPADNTSTATTSVTQPTGGGGGGGFTGGGGGGAVNTPPLGGGLPFTGAPASQTVLGGLVLTLVGCVLLGATRRRTSA